MDRREFLKNFVALSSASVLIAGCVKPLQKESIPKKKIKESLPDSSKKDAVKKETTIVPKDSIKENNDVPLAVYGPPPIR